MTLPAEPQRVSLPQPTGKPIQVVLDLDSKPVISGEYWLAWHATKARYYVARRGQTWTDGNLKTSDLATAIKLFWQVVANKRGDRLRIKRPVRVTVGSEAVPLRGSMPSQYVATNQDGSAEVVSEVDAADFYEAVSDAATSDPDAFRKATGMVRVAGKRGATLASLIAAYRSKRQAPRPTELRKVETYWTLFTRKVGVSRVSEIASDHIDVWDAAVWEIYDAGGSPKTMRHYYEYVTRVLRYAADKLIDAEECERVYKEIYSRKKELPALNNPNPEPITREHFKMLLDAADDRWKAILLLALNCAYYPVDIRTFPVAALNLEKGWIIFDRAKTDQTTRVSCLWKRTIDAIRAYHSDAGHDSEMLFPSQKGSQYSDQGFRHAWHDFRETTGVPKTVEFASLRDGAYTAAIQGGASETVAKILAGHKIGGMSDAYIKANPAIVKPATDAIEAEYFPDEPNPSKKSKQSKKGGKNIKPVKRQIAPTSPRVATDDIENRIRRETRPIVLSDDIESGTIDQLREVKRP